MKKRLLSILLTACLLVGLLPVTVLAAEPTDANYFKFDNTTGTINGLKDEYKDMTEVIIPESIDGVNVTSIGDSAFMRCSSLTSITIPNSVTSIGEFAFTSCTSLTSITIPNGVTSIGEYAFTSCTSLTSITIPDGVASIGEQAFSNCTNLTSITIPNNISVIGMYVFSDCTNLTSITIPNSVTEILMGAFSGCSGLKDVYYLGTKEQWDNIQIGSRNGDLTSNNKVRFAAGETSSTLSVSAYATKVQLMDNTFAPNSSGNAANIGKLVFGKNSESNSQEWYILGKDKGVSGNNTIIFAASPIATNQVFEDDFSDNKTFKSSFGAYASNPTEVYPNHYGASDLRVALRNMATNASYFTTAERGLMNPTRVTTKDTKNSTNYTTTDKLYALQGDYNNNQYLWAGTGDSTVLAMNSYCSDEYLFWLRSPCDYSDYGALLASPGDDNGDYVINYDVDWDEQVQPASNLNLSFVLFASAAKASSSGTAESGTIAEGTAMTLRFNGRGNNIGTVTYNTTTGDVKAVKGTTSQTVALVVQGRGTVRREEKDWYYSKQIGTSETINASAIKSALGLSSDIDLSDCKIWLEITDTDGLIYAVNATETTIADISSVEITGIEIPAANTTLDTSASCATTGVSSTTPQITWTPSDTTAGYNTSYTASITLTAGTGYEFTDSTTATVNGNTATSVTKNADGTLTVTYTFPGISDTIAPVISGVENGKTYCSAQTVTVSDNDAIEKVTVNGTEVTLDENNQFTLSPEPGEQKIIATDKSDNPAEVTVTINDGHTYGKWQSNGDGTHTRHCTVDGCNGYEDGNCAGGTATCKAKAICDYCGSEYGEIDSSNHNLDNIPAKDAIVTETGNKEYWQCRNCKKYFADEKGTNEIELDDTIISKLPPVIIEGKGQSITTGEKKALSFTSNAAIGDFIRVELDGKTLDAKNYTVKEGSTIVNLKADYVATLSAGEHTIGIVSTSGTAVTTFTVAELQKPTGNNPSDSTGSNQIDPTGNNSNTGSVNHVSKTGDATNLALWIILSFVSGILLSVFGIYGKKKKHNR